MIKVMIVDDHRLVRVGLAALLDSADDITVAVQAADGSQAVESARTVELDVVLMDLSMPVMDGVTATRRIMLDRPGTRIVILSSFSDQVKVREAISAGATGYVLKDSTPEQLLGAVRSAAQGHAPLDPRVAGALLRSGPERADGTGLSDREVQVLRLTGKGLANKQIGRALGITERTVKVHLTNVFRRIGVNDRTSAALWARDNLPPE